MTLIQTQRGTFNISDHRRDDCPNPPLLLLHGAGGSRLVWPREIRRMPCSNAIALDLSGHGKSPGSGHSRIADHAADVVALLDALHIPRAILCGHSMGGAIAQMVAIEHPDRAAGLVLINTGARLRVHPDLLKLSHADVPAAIELLDNLVWSGDSAAGHRMGMHAQLQDLSPGVLHADYVACDGFDVRDRLHEITAPVLVIGGNDDRMTPPRFSRFLYENIPNATLALVEDGSHFTLLEKSRHVADHLSDWLQQHQNTFLPTSEG